MLLAIVESVLSYYLSYLLVGWLLASYDRLLLALGAAGMVAIYTLWFSALTKQGIAPKSINVVFVTCLLEVFSPSCAVFQIVD